MCLWNTDAPGGNKVKIWQKFLSPLFWPAPPQGQVMSEKCEEPIDELTVQVWLLYHHPNFKYCTLFVSGTELRTDRRTDKQTNKQMEGRSNYRCPRWTFQAGGIKILGAIYLHLPWLWENKLLQKTEMLMIWCCRNSTPHL